MIVSLSILSAPLLDLSTTITQMIESGIDRLHLDIMDGHYVPRIAFGIDWIHAIHTAYPKLPIDAHLMVSDVDYSRYTSCYQSGVQHLWLHHETLPLHIASTHTHWVLSLENSAATLPSTTTHVLIMAVTPGAGGQQLSPHVYTQIHDVRRHYPAAWIAVDGGVNTDNVASLHQAGVDEVILGHGLISSSYPSRIIQKIHAL